MERTGQCRCGSLQVITAGEPDRVYLCHCKACQRHIGTAFHFGATCSKERVRVDGVRKIYERDADSGYRIRFHFARVAAPLPIGKGTATQWSAESQWARSTHRHFRRPAIRPGRRRSIRGSVCRRGWTTSARADHRPHERSL
jgi:hypothetical protein